MSRLWPPVSGQGAISLTLGLPFKWGQCRLYSLVGTDLVCTCCPGILLTVDWWGPEVGSLAQIPGPQGQPRAGLCSEVRDKEPKGETKPACPLPGSKHQLWGGPRGPSDPAQLQLVHWERSLVVASQPRLPGAPHTTSPFRSWCHP